MVNEVAAKTLCATVALAIQRFIDDPNTRPVPVIEAAVLVYRAALKAPPMVDPPDPEPIKGKVKYFPGHYFMADSLSTNGTHKDLEESLDAEYVKGVKVQYGWGLLEAREGAYAQGIARIRKDLVACQQAGKKLIIGLECKEFGESDWNECAPRYVHDKGGVYLDRERGGRDAPPRGMAKLYEPWVRDRYLALFHALGKEFDADQNIAAITTCETAGQGGPGRGKAYLAALAYLDANVGKAFPTTIAFRLANWFGGDVDADLAMRGFFDACLKYKTCGISCPDIMVARETTASRIWPQYAGRIPLAAEGQSLHKYGGNRIEDTWEFAINDQRGLSVGYMLWPTANRAPFDRGSIKQEIARRKGAINRSIPSSLNYKAAELAM